LEQSFEDQVLLLRTEAKALRPELRAPHADTPWVREPVRSAPV